MFQILVKFFIKDYKDYTNPKVREKYGRLCSIVCIISNVVLGIFKMFFGVITNSIAILSDGINNFTDVGSNIATWVGFKVAAKRPDKDHPYGHGRSEYIVGLFIAFFIMIVGVLSLQESLEKIFNPKLVYFSIPALIALIISIGIKMWMSIFSANISRKIQSPTLMALSKDSLNDVWSTTGALIALVASLYTDLPVDGMLGVVVSIIIVKTGYDVCKETIDPLLGKAPDKGLVNELQTYIMSKPGIIGVHDLMFHDYGPGRQFLTLHAEVDVNGDLMTTHDHIDQVEKDILAKYNIFTTVHIDPIDLCDERIIQLKQKLDHIVTSINQDYSIHDFRAIFFENHANVIFDLLLPIDDTIDHDIVYDILNKKVSKLDGDYHLIVQIEHGYI